MLISLRNINFSYNEQNIFINYNKDFNSNLIHLVGENGSGKSTLLKILAGKLKYSGSIYIDNKKIKDNSLSKVFTLVNQDIALIEKYTVSKNLLFVSSNLKNDYIKKFGFEDKLSMKVSNLSGGWKKKLMILMAFLSNSSVLLLDEYTNFLDKDVIEDVNKLIKEYSKDHVVIYVDHNYDIGGTITKIESEEVTEIKETNEKYKVKHKFGFRLFFLDLSIIKVVSTVILSLLTSLLIFLLSYTSIAYYSDISIDQEIQANFCVENDIKYFTLMYEDDNTINHQFYVDDDTICAKLLDSNDSVKRYYYTMTYYNCDLNDIFDLNIIAEKEDAINLYVFKKNEFMLGQSFTYNDQTYYINGVILRDNIYEDDEYNTFFVEGIPSSYNYKAALLTNDEVYDFVRNCRAYYNYDNYSIPDGFNTSILNVFGYFNYLTGKLYRSAKLYKCFDELTFYKYMHIYANILTYVITIFLYWFILKVNKTKYNIMINYNISTREIFYSNILSSIISSLVISALSCAISTFILRLYIKESTNSFTLQTTFNYMIYYFILFFVLLLIIYAINILRYNKKSKI